MAVEHNWDRNPDSTTPGGLSSPQGCPCARRCWTALRSCRLARWGSPPRSGRSWTPSRRAWWWVVLEKSDFWLVNISKQFKFSKEAETCQHKRQAFHFEQRGRWCSLRRGLSANQWSSPFQPGEKKSVTIKFVYELGLIRSNFNQYLVTLNVFDKLYEK